MRLTEGLLQAIAVAAELTGTELSKPAIKAMAMDLAVYPEEQVVGALTRCRREIKGRLTPQSVIERLDDGRPGPEEAFAMLPRGEGESVVWTEEMAEAASIAQRQVNDGDMVAARMAFREVYQRIMLRARDERRPVRWIASWGWEPDGRERAVIEAVARGRITQQRAVALLPSLSDAGFAAMGLPAPKADAVGLARLARAVTERGHD